MIFILLPAFNEEKTLPRLLEKIILLAKNQEQDITTLLCNDSSSDETLKVIKPFESQMPLTIINHPINRGLGETSRDLFEKAAELAKVDDVIIRMDADDTHSPEYIPLMLEKLEQGYDIVIASRFANGGGQKGVNFYRAMISRAANLFMKVIFPVSGVCEYSCGFRAYRASIIKKAIYIYGNNFIQLKGLGFTGTLEKLIKLNLIGAKFSEVPFILRYDLKDSPSKMVTSVTTMGYLVMAVLYHWPWSGWRTAYKNLNQP
jgi:dolichol-phosphate mannosyltransferase